MKMPKMDMASPPMVPAASGNQNGRDLRIPGFQVRLVGRHKRFALPDLVVFVQDVDTCVDGYAAQQDERGKPSLVEIQFEPIECKEYADVGDRYHEDNGQRLFQRIEQDTGGKEDNDDDQQ